MDAEAAHAWGSVKEKIYLGMYNRYVISLREGGELTVVAQNSGQNRGTDRKDFKQGDLVQLVWICEHMRRVGA